MNTTSYSIQSESLPDVSWKKNKNVSKLNAEDIHIWKISVSEHFSYLFKNYRFVLNEDEFEKAKKYFRERDVKRYLTGRIVLKKLLAKYLNKPAISIHFDSKDQKPSVVSKMQLKYNLSYSGEYIIIAFARCEIGVDIEESKRDFNIDSLLSACFAENEIFHIKSNSKASKELFFLQWTRKEAVLKFTGQGIIDDLSAVPSLDGNHVLNDNTLRIKENIKLSSFKLDHDYIASIVYPDKVLRKKFFIW